ncbi:MAG: hypothetical protein ACXAEU_03025 [Candidatus Hodarchaeales archaeon]|jgi:hypothetical protein
MKRNNMFLLATAFLVMMIMSMGIQATAGKGIKEATGHDFGDESFAVDIDFNKIPTGITTLPSETTLIRDYVDSSNPLADPADSDYPTKDRQFFLSYVNTSGIETAYIALEKIEQDIKIGHALLSQDFVLGHVNATAPFQSLVQHYESYLHDIFVTNFFNGFIAYETTATDPWMDSSDKMYLGYSMVESHLLDIISGAISTAGWDPIGQYGWDAFFNAPDPTSGISSWGIEYSNMMVFWQELGVDFTTDTGVSLPPGATIEGIEGVVTGGNLVAATVFDTMKFSYELEETTTTTTDAAGDDWLVTEAEVTTVYDLGAVSLIITLDDATKLNQLQTNVDGIDSTNSFNIPSQTITLGSVTISPVTYVFEVTLPSFSFYKDTAARKRIDAAAMENYAKGMGISAVSSTNMYSVGYTVDFQITNDAGEIQTHEYPIVVGGEKAFDTSFTGKDEYELDLTIDGGLATTYPIGIATVVPSNNVYVKNIFTEYFEVERKMMRHFLGFMAYQTSPLIANQITPTSTSAIKMDVVDSGYLMFVQMPEWSGYPITQDPTFSAVSAVKAGDSTETSGETTTSDGILGSIPGFELLAAVAAVPVIVLIYKKRK